jgi:hypothetical protein
MTKVITQQNTLLDQVTGTPVGGVEVCTSATCATCGAPGTPFAQAVTDGDGGTELSLQVPASDVGTQSGFQGCAAISSPGIVTAWAVMGFPQTEPMWSVSITYSPTLLNPTENANAIASVGGVWDAGAEMSFRVYDCLGVPAPGVQVSLPTQHENSATGLWYIGHPALLAAADSALPDAGATLAGGSFAGEGLFINVPLLDESASYENVLVTATPLSLGRASSQVVTQIRAGVLTEVELVPTP